MFGEKNVNFEVLSSICQFPVAFSGGKWAVNKTKYSPFEANPDYRDQITWDKKLWN